MDGRLTDEESNALETIYSNTKVGFTTEVIPQDIAVGGGKIVTLLKYTATAPTTTLALQRLMTSWTEARKLHDFQLHDSKLKKVLRAKTHANFLVTLSMHGFSTSHTTLDRHA